MHLRRARHAPCQPDVRVRRRLRDLPHVGGLLAAADRRPGCISPLPGGGGLISPLSPPATSSTRCSSSSRTGRFTPAPQPPSACSATRPAAGRGGGSIALCRASQRSSEAAYRFISMRRGLLTGATHLLWGRALEPARYDLVAWLFLRGLGLIYLAAFVSLALQIRGLVGSDGILPLGEYLAAAHAGWGTDAYWRLPTLFWLNASDAALMAGALAGIALSPAGHVRHCAAPRAHRPLRPLPVVRLRRAAVLHLPVGHAADRGGLPRHLPHRRLGASSSGSTACCCSASCSSPGSSSSPRATRPGSS